MEPPIAIACVFILVIAEMILSARWNRAYFTYGIPVFVRRVERPRGIADLSVEELQASTVTAAGAALVFQRLDPNVIAFRERFFGGGMMHYTPIMHGVIRHDPGEGAVRVIGILNWFVVAFLVVMLALLGRGIVDLLPVIAVVAAVIYFIQSVRYNRVATKLATV